MIFNPTKNPIDSDQKLLVFFTNPDSLNQFLKVIPELHNFRIYAPSSFKSRISKLPTISPINFLPFLATLDIVISARVHFQVEAHATNKSLLRCIWIIRRKNLSNVTQIKSLTPAIGNSLVLSEEVYLVGFEGQPDKFYLDIVIDKLYGEKFTLIDKPGPIDSTNPLMKRSALIQFQETLDETIRASLLRKGKLIIASDLPLSSYLRCSDLFKIILSRVPAHLKCPFSLYGDAVTKYLMELDTNVYNSTFFASETSSFNFESPKFKSKFYAQILDKSLEVILSPQFAAKKIDQPDNSVCLYSLLTMKSIIDIIHQIENEKPGFNPLLATKLNVLSANQSLSDWQWKYVLKAFLDVQNDTKIILYLVNEENSHIDENLFEKLKTKYNIQFIALPIYSFEKNVWACDSSTPILGEPCMGGYMVDLENGDTTFDVPTEGHFLIPLTIGQDEPIFMLVRNEMILNGPICQLTLNAEDQTEFIDGHQLV